jgi:predicted DCC family thiol-disulfide oxidoreductase YuxK
MAHSTQANPAGRSVVLYDGQCPFCRRSVALLRRLDWLGRLRYHDARDADHLPPSNEPLHPPRLLEQMHVLSPGGDRAFAGFGAVRYLAWRLPALWAVAPLLYLPGIPVLGQRIYLWVAKNRFQLVPCHGGVCALPHRSPRAPSPGEGRTVRLDRPAPLP